MPPKPMIYKTPDGKEFTSKSEWRDYMMSTFYSFKNKVSVDGELVKKPGDIDGQMFDIANCSNSTLIIMDYCEQVQIDEVNDCKIFIGACASSIFIRNCKNCTFYTCCRQLRLRDVEDCLFFIHTMSEVHIEFTTRIKLAPFYGGYPEHGTHLNKANLDINRNLWYEVFDHNDPEKSHRNWSLLEEPLHNQPWYPTGTICEDVLPKPKPGSINIHRDDNTMHSYSIQTSSQVVTSLPPPVQTKVTKTTSSSSTLPETNHETFTNNTTNDTPPLPPSVTHTTNTTTTIANDIQSAENVQLSTTVATVVANDIQDKGATTSIDIQQIMALLTQLTTTAGDLSKISQVIHPDAQLILSNGTTHPLSTENIHTEMGSLLSIQYHRISPNQDIIWGIAHFEIPLTVTSQNNTICTASFILQKVMSSSSSIGGEYQVILIHKSTPTVL